MYLCKWEDLRGYDARIGEVVEAFMTKENVYELPAGRYELCGGCFVFVNLLEAKENLRFEAHKRYVDVQLLLVGEEEIYYAPVQAGVLATEYDEEKDIVFYTCESFTKVKPRMGEAVVLYPEDLHAPCNGEEGKIRKLVFKIPVTE